MKKIKRFYILILAVLMLTGCTSKSEKYNTSCNVWSVSGSNAGSHYICANSEDTYIYQCLSDVCGLYDFNTQELIIPIDDSDRFCCMAVSDDYLVYHSKDTYGTIHVYSLETHEQVLVLDHMDVVGIKADGNNVFAVVKEQNADGYDIAVFNNGEYVWMNSVLEALEPTKLEDGFGYYDYDGYSYITKNQNDINEIVYIENQNWKFDCSQEDIYIHTTNGMYSISQMPEALPEKMHGHGGISTSMVCEKDNECYVIVQYSKKKYQENPSVDFVQPGLLCKYSIDDENLEVLYEAKQNEQIVGFSSDTDDVYILTNAELYKQNINTGEQVHLLENRFQDSTERGTYYFENYDNCLMVWSRAFPNVESGPTFEGEYLY